MKYLVLIILCVSSIANARMGKQPASMRYNIQNKTVMKTYQLNPVDINSLLKTHQQKNYVLKPLKFAVGNTIKVTPKSHGTWTNVPGGKIWNLRFKSENATDINFGFTQFYLPKGVELYLLSFADNPVYYNGPYTFEDNQDYKQFWSAVLPGGDVAVELFVPDNVVEQFELELTKVSTGFRDVFKRYGGKGLAGNQGRCNVEVACEIAEPWLEEINSVAMYSILGIDLCSGTMIMNTEENFQPYFLTASHCVTSAANAATIVTYWNFQSVKCGDFSGGLKINSIEGARILERRENTDMILVELSGKPPEDYNVFYSGWDRSGSVPEGSIGIHHPRADEKAISINYDRLTHCQDFSRLEQWKVDNWEHGITESGSSGSGLWDIDSHMLVGTLSGGFSSCDEPAEFDCYNKIFNAWDDDSGPQHNLKHWLDSGNTGLTSIAGSYNFKDCLIAFINYILDGGERNKHLNTKDSQSINETLYVLRDKHLSKTYLGKQWVTAYYDFSPEIVEIILNKDSSLTYDFYKTLSNIYPAIQRHVNHKPYDVKDVFSYDNYLTFNSIVNRLQQYGSSELIGFIKYKLNTFPFKSYINKGMDVMVNDALKHAIYK